MSAIYKTDFTKIAALNYKDVFRAPRLYKVSSYSSPHTKHWQFICLVLIKEASYSKFIVSTKPVSGTSKDDKMLNLKTNSPPYKTRGFASQFIFVHYSKFVLAPHRVTTTSTRNQALIVVQLSSDSHMYVHFFFNISRVFALSMSLEFHFMNASLRFSRVNNARMMKRTQNP